MRIRLTLLSLLAAFALNAQLPTFEFDNFSINPALADPSHQMEADAFYGMDGFHFYDGGLSNLAGQVNYWVGDRHNVGVRYKRRQYGPEVTHSIRGSYAHKFRINELKLIPAMGVTYSQYHYDPNSISAPPAIYSTGRWMSTSIGIGAYYENLVGGIYLEDALQVTGPDVRQVSPRLSSHLSYNWQAHPNIKLIPLARASYRNAYFHRLELLTGIGGQFWDIVEVRANFYRLWTEEDDYAESRLLQGTIGWKPLDNLWIRYQHSLGLEGFYSYISFPSHNVGVSFDMPR